MKNNPLNMIDFYKADHRRQYPKGTTKVYSNFTPRSNRFGASEEMVFFGLQYFIKEYLVERWNKGFFSAPKDTVIKAYKRRMDNALGLEAISVQHIGELHDLGYLPIKIKALPEGTKVPMGVPALTIENTHDNFFWLTNYLESILSAILWKPCTSATTAMVYKKRFLDHAIKTGYQIEDTNWQGHDFSFRGMSGLEDACMSSAGHLLSFTGTDTVSAIDFLEDYYNANSEKEMIGGSVPATEHSVMCANGLESEIDTFKRLITETYPNGVVSIVSDTWDFWKVITEYIPELKAVILARSGGLLDRVVIRPDSGNPVDIICGIQGPWNSTSYNHYKDSMDCSQKGAYECLWDTFGGHVNENGYKVLSSKIGLIYGDSITLDRQNEILNKLEAKGFCASNLVLGIGSYTYEYVTRDTYGSAMKATYIEVNGVGKEIFKDPKTDSGLKKSAKGLLKVYRHTDGTIKLKDQCTRKEEQESLLTDVFIDGRLLNDVSLNSIRNTITI